MILLFAAALATPPVADVGYTELSRGENNAAIAVIGADQVSYDPAKRINLAIAHARRGDTELARRHFQMVIDSRDVVELQTATGAWIDARTIARRGIAMLDQGTFSVGARVARK